MNGATFYNSRFVKLGFPWVSTAPKTPRIESWGAVPPDPLHVGGLRSPNAQHLGKLRPQTIAIASLLDDICSPFNIHW